jgi:predicted nucleic-acid-binding protein
MIGLDTNILARYYMAESPTVDDAAIFKQCEAARAD